MAIPRVTITLGGSSKVVKSRDNVMVDHRRMSGNKRFIQDKPWSHDSGDKNFMFMNKRHRGDATGWRSGSSRVQGSRITGNDLRLKLMRKRRSHHFHNVSREYRKWNSEKISHDQPPQNLGIHPTRPGPNEISNLNQFTNNGITDGMHLCSFQTMDGPRGFVEIPQIVPTAPARADFFPSNGFFDTSRTTGMVPITEKVITARPVTYVAPLSSIMQRRPHVDEEPFTVATFLNSLGLGKYAILFRAEEVDMTALREMGDRDLKEMGIPMGPRKKLLLALRPPSRRHLSHIRH